MTAPTGREADILAEIQNEPLPTYVLARRFKTTSQKMRRALIKMEGAGIVERCARYSCINSITWQVAKHRCAKCDGTGYKDYAGFAMDSCDHG